MTDVVFVTVDSLRADHVGSYGYERETTPNLDPLAEANHRFTNAFSHAGATRMSFPSILTSSHALTYGGFESISERRTLVSEVLDESGYRTGAFHSNPFLSAEFGYDRGFDHFFDSKTDPSVLSRLRQSVKNTLNEDGVVFRTLKRAFDATEKHAGVEVGSAYVTADDLTDRAVDWLEDTDESRPVFLWTHYMDPHHPYVPPKEYQRAFRDDPVSDRDAVQLRRKMLESPADITDSELATLIDLYDAEIRFFDAEVGRLLDAADRLLDDPVVVFTADHGEEFRDHGQFSHNTFHDEGIHVPLVVADGQGSGVYDDVVGLMDLAPTIASYCRCEPAETWDGNDLRSLLEGGSWDREWVVGEGGTDEGGDRNYFYRDRRWKYVDTDEESLYDLDADPNERTDVAADHPEQLERIQAILSEHTQAVTDSRTRLDDVTVDGDIEDRLRKLGYKE